MKKNISYIICSVLLLTVSFPINGKAIAATTTSKKEPRGYLMLYSNGGQYNKALIVTYDSDNRNQGTPFNERKCNNKNFKKYNDNNRSSIAVGLKADRPVKILCSAANYNIYYYKKGQNISNELPVSDSTKYTAVGLVGNYCSFVHQDGVTRNEQIVVIDRKASCKGTDDKDENAVKKKIDPIMTLSYEPQTIMRGKKMLITLELKLNNGEPLSPEECVGAFRAGTGDIDEEYPVRYNAKTKSCMYKLVKGGTFTKNFKLGEKTVTAKFDGNKFLNATNATNKFTVIDNPKSKKF